MHLEEQTLDEIMTNSELLGIYNFNFILQLSSYKKKLLLLEYRKLNLKYF